MTYDDSFLDDYDHYEDLFDPLKTDRKARRARKPRAVPHPKKLDKQVLAEIADSTDALEGEFKTTYQPSRYEAGWLLESLRSFYDQDLITDVLALVKGGKEASVYRCAANPVTGASLLAAKVYRPRMFRQLRNDKMYREGRAILTADGRAVKKNDHRIMRAIGKKTAFGAEVAHTSWLMYEYTTLQRLYQAGAAVPKPVVASENAILMGYIGDDRMAAPLLSEVRLDRDEAAPLFDEVLRNIHLMLQQHVVHGDLSAYNILYWEGTITLIDFPQVTDVLTNRNAYVILRRDVTRICEYFARQGVSRDPMPIVDSLWHRYVQTPPGELEGDNLEDVD